jgi:hypothetical protein
MKSNLEYCQAKVCRVDWNLNEKCCVVGLKYELRLTLSGD